MRHSLDTEYNCVLGFVTVFNLTRFALSDAVQVTFENFSIMLPSLIISVQLPTQMLNRSKMQSHVSYDSITFLPTSQNLTKN